MVRLRKLELSDVPAMALLANNKNIQRNLREGFPNPYTEEHAEGFIKSQLAIDPPNVMAIVFDEELAGVVGLTPHENQIFELGFWLGEPFWGKKIMSKAVELYLAYAAKTFDYKKLIAKVHETNIGSKRVVEKNGFKFVGYDDEVCNSIQEDVKSLLFELSL